MQIIATAVTERTPEPTLHDRLQNERFVKVSALGITGALTMRNGEMFFSPDGSHGGFYVKPIEITRVFRKYSPRKKEGVYA